MSNDSELAVKLIYRWLDVKAYFITNSFKNKICVLHIINKNKYENSNVFVFSHSDNVDLSHIFPFLIDLSTQLKCDIISYDYSGYGISTGTPNDSTIIDDLTSVLVFTEESLNYEKSKIILIGFSLGTFPTLRVACEEKFYSVFSIIVLSPIIECFQIVGHRKTLSINYHKIYEIICPVFVIHGKMDELVSQVTIAEKIKMINLSYSWFPKEGDHQNIPTKYRHKFIDKIKFFVGYVKNFYLQKDNTRSEYPSIKKNEEGISPKKTLFIYKSILPQNSLEFNALIYDAKKVTSSPQNPFEKKITSPKKNLKENQYLWSPQKTASTKKSKSPYKVMKETERISAVKRKSNGTIDENSESKYLNSSNDIKKMMLYFDHFDKGF